VSLLALVAGLLLAGPPAQDAFRADMIQRLKRDHPAHRFQPAADPLSIQRDLGSKDEEATLNLHNLHAYCGAVDVPACDSAKAEWARRVMLAPVPVTRASLRLMVRNADYVAFANNPAGGGGASGQPLLFSRPIGDDLFLLVASDAPETIQMVGFSQAAALKMSEAEVWAAAGANMAAILPELPDAASLRREAAGIEGIPFGSAMLGRTDHWRKVAKDSGGELFVTVVSDDFLMVALASDTNVARFAPTVSKDCAEAPRCISPHIYRFRAGGWRIAEPDHGAGGLPSTGR
jgi:hypothetical protein